MCLGAARRRRVADAAALLRRGALLPPHAEAAEAEEHEASGHVAHGSWCTHCMAARAAINPHRRFRVDPTDGDPRIRVGYYFMGEEEATLHMLAVKDSKSKACFQQQQYPQRAWLQARHI